MDTLKSLSDSISALAKAASAKLFHVPSSMGGRTALGFDEKLLLVPASEASQGETLKILAPGGTEVEAMVKGFDPDLGLAVLELGKELPGTAWTAASAPPALASLVLVAAYPSPEGPEARFDALRFAGGQGDDAYLQTDGAPFPGFAGAAIVEPEGKLAGFLLADRGGNRGWALPASRAISLVSAIASGQASTKAWLGVSTVPVAAPSELAALFGDGRATALLVAGVEADSPAAKAGLRVGDILASIGGRALSEPGDLLDALDGAKPGVELPLVVFRSGEKRDLSATPAARDRGEGRRSGSHGHRGHRGPWWMGGGPCGWASGR